MTKIENQRVPQPVCPQVIGCVMLQGIVEPFVKVIGLMKIVQDFSTFLLRIGRNQSNTRVSFDAIRAEGTGFEGQTRHYALQLIDGVARDLSQSHYPHFEDLSTYCYGVASTVGLMSMHIVGFKSSEAVPCAIKLGVALQMTNILRDVGEDFEHGRVYLPQDELEAFGIQEAELASGKVTDKWREFMRSSRIVHYGGLKDAAKKLNILSGAQTPLMALFWVATQNTAVSSPKGSG